MSSREHLHLPKNLGEVIADAVVGGMGSWKFIIIQTIIVAAWICSNLWLLSRPFDIYPFVLLNLMFSTQAAYAAPLILMSSNRAAARDKKRDDLESEEVEEIDTLIKSIHTINLQQTEILQQQNEILDFLKAKK